MQRFAYALALAGRAATTAGGAILPSATWTRAFLRKQGTGLNMVWNNLLAAHEHLSGIACIAGYLLSCSLFSSGVRYQASLPAAAALLAAVCYAFGGVLAITLL